LPHPHALSSSLEKLLEFHGDNAIGARKHCDAFMEHIITLGVFHLDVLYKWFSSSLRKDAAKCFLSLFDNNINCFQACQKVLFEIWLEKKDSQFILNSLTNIKRSENETIDEFENRFDKIL